MRYIVLIMLTLLVALFVFPFMFTGEKNPTRLAFMPVNVPVNAETKAALQVSQEAVDLHDGARQGIGFIELMRTGDADNGETFGVLKDLDDRPLRLADGTPYICNGTNDVPGAGPDFMSILNNPDGSGKLYMVAQFECGIGAYYMNELQQDGDGTLRSVPGTLRYISQKAFHGGWVHCAGSVTPWESHLGSEEYPRDARNIEALRQSDGTTGIPWFDETAKHYGGDASQANPYYWGWTTEVRVEQDEPAYSKHYALGRFSHELAYVMPDRRTVYLTDDGKNTGFFMFVADEAEKLERGTLYAAKWHQQSSENGGSAQLEWVSLGHASADAIREVVDSKPLFSQLFDTEEPYENGGCPDGFAAVNTDGNAECLKMRNDVYGEAVISRLETRRFAAIKGATAEFRKEEGLTYDPDRNRLYVGMSAISHGMLADDAKYDRGGADHIRLPENQCGGVYALNVASAPQQDSEGKPIASDFVVSDMTAVLTGIPTSYDEKGAYAGNECDVKGIANPDNLTYLPGSNLLVIGEDSKRRANNMVWAYDVESGALQRIATLPSGAEATSTYWTSGINGYDYLNLVVQHPDGEDNQSYAGVIGPFKTLKK